MYLASGSAGSAGVCALIAATLLWWPRLTRNESAGAPTLLWTQLTNFNDSAETPTLSRDGKLVAFLRGPGSFGSCCEHGPGLDQICAGRRTLVTHEDRL